MNLDLDDDPLGDLLSDGSNDSLFGIEPPKKVPTKVEKKDMKEPAKKMEQLFGISEEKFEQIMPKMENPSSSPIRNVPKALPRSAPPPKSPTRSNNDSLTSDLGFDPKQPKKKSSVLDELLGITASESTAKLPQKSTSKAPISRQTTSETTMSEQHVGMENPLTTARKTSRRQSAVAFSDPLGLLGEQQPSIKKTQKASARKSIAGTEWLFNNPPPLTKLKSSPLIQVTSNVNVQKQQEDELGSSNVTSLESKGKAPPPPIMESLVADTQKTLNNLKQQEFQLMVAAQMKTQENVLVEMKNKQQELLKQQVCLSFFFKRLHKFFIIVY
jgi:Fas-binding factor 1